MVRLLPGCLLLVQLACVPVPALSPPVRLDAGGGLALGRPKAVPDAGHAVKVLSLRATAFPWQSVFGQADRRFDFGLGYVGEPLFPAGRDPVWTHGPCLALAAHPWFTPLDGRRFARLALVSNGELLTTQRSPERTWGGGATLTLSLELGFFAQAGWATTQQAQRERTRDVEQTRAARLPDEMRPAPDPMARDIDPPLPVDMIGYALGETTIGLFVQTSLRHFPGDTYWLLVGGIQARLPLLAAIFFFYVY